MPLLQFPDAELGMQGREVAFEQRPDDRLGAGALALADRPGPLMCQDPGAAGRRAGAQPHAGATGTSA